MMNGSDVLFYALDGLVICKYTVKQHIMTNLMSSMLQGVGLGIGLDGCQELINKASRLADGIVNEGCK
jgi:hypothetical protein